MRITLDRLDIKPEFENINCSQTRIEHFKPEIQAVIRRAGRATFHEYDNSNYNAIFDRNVTMPFTDEVISARLQLARELIAALTNNGQLSPRLMTPETKTLWERWQAEDTQP